MVRKDAQETEPKEAAGGGTPRKDRPTVDSEGSTGSYPVLQALGKRLATVNLSTFMQE